MWGYRARLERDLARWRERGWISEAAVQEIGRDLAARGRGIGLPTTLAVLGAVLIGFAAMSFVAANWQEMPRIARLGLLLAALWGCYGLAGALLARGLDGFGHAAVLAGAGLFGAGIMLIAQMYHIDGNPPDAVLAWAAGALLAGALLQSNPALALAMLLVGLWSGWQTALVEAVHWPFLVGWAAVAAAFLWRRWRPGLHLSALVLSAWIVSLGYLLLDGHAHWAVALIGLGIAGGALAAETLPGIWRRIAPAVLCYGMAIAYAGLFAFKFFEKRDPGTLALLSVLAMAMLLAAVFWGWRNEHKPVLWLGYIGFSAEVLALYFVTIGTLLGTSVFFLMAGLIVIGLSWLAYRLHTQQSETREALP
ncbi:MAG: DUF2157 domain-containing protein [Hyphomicrobiaceae bacterium]|nr:DUF2157 domain-containing protein [Hyphomicrobiaceae bacterium]